MKSRSSIGLHRFLLGLALLAWVALAAAGEVAATVVFSSGSPRIVDAAGAERIAAKGAELRAGETLDTRDGIVQLRFRDGASMSLQTATRFKVDDYVFAGADGKAAEGDRGFFSLIRGGFRTITGLIGKARRDQYRVGTNAAVIGIRGTSYQAALDDSGLTVGTTAGLVAVCNDTGCVEVRPGETVFVSGPSVPPKRLRTATAPDDGAAGQLPPPSLQGGGLQPPPSAGSTSPAPPTGVTTPTGPSVYTPPAGPTGPTGYIAPTPALAAPTSPTAPTAPTGFTVAPTGATAAPAPTTPIR